MRYFDALASTRHFGTAAAREGISQPALSGQIAEMGKTAGVPMFERMSRGSYADDCRARLPAGYPQNPETGADT